VKWPCFYGIDFATRAELIATGLGTDDICRSIDADSLGYISLEELVEATGVPMPNLCRACFDGVYPVDLPEPEHLGKHLLELQPRHAAPAGPDREAGEADEVHEAVVRSPDGLAVSLSGAGAADALDRP
jgi:amidophosphoribosyltransferase